MKPTSRSALFVLLKPYFSWVILALTVICAPISAQQPLPAEKAFAMHVMAKNNGKINLQWQIAPEYQIYRESIIVSNATILHWPKPKPYTDSLGHTKSIYTGTLTLQGKLRDNSKKLIYVNFQGCHGKQQCYPPQHLAFDIAHTDQWLAPQEQKTTHDSMVFSLLGFFMAGILLAFTPCVLPLLPVLAGVLFGQQTPSIRHKLWVAGLYVFSMALTYALAGLLAAWLGYSIQSTLQSPLIIISFACVLLGMGILMWMDSPPAWLSWCMTRQHTTNRWYTPILLGSTTLLVASPCTTPAFIAALTYISATGNLALGGLGLFLLGLGMGMPLLVVALLGVQVLPKSGLWLQKSKKIGALLLIGMAVWLGGRASSPYLHIAVSSPQHKAIASSDTLNATIQRAHDADKPLVLFYTASWCATCQSLKDRIFNNPEALKKLSNASIAWIDISQNSPEALALMQTFHVIAPPTIIIIKPDLTRAVLVGNVTFAKLRDKILEK